jgi:hypothetical protein
MADANDADDVLDIEGALQLPAVPPAAADDILNGDDDEGEIDGFLDDVDLEPDQEFGDGLDADAGEYNAQDFEKCSANPSRIRSGVIPAPPTATTLEMLPSAIKQLIRGAIGKFFVVGTDTYARARELLPKPAADMETLLDFGTALLAALEEYDGRLFASADDVFREYTRLHSDAELFERFSGDVYARQICAATAGLLDAIQVDATTHAPTVRATLLLYDSVRKSTLKSHVLPLGRMAAALRDWPVLAENTQPGFRDADAVMQSVGFKRAFGAGSVPAAGPAAAAAAWIAARATVAHTNMLHIMGVMSDAGDAAHAQYTRTYKHVGVQLVVHRVGVVNATDHSLAGLFANVCHRVHNVIVPFSQNAVASNVQSGFAGTLYYQYERKRVVDDVEKTRRVWGAIGGRKFWKQLAVLAKSGGASKRSFAICVSGGGTKTSLGSSAAAELKQMYAYVELLGVGAGRREGVADLVKTTQLGRLMYTVTQCSVAAHNMGILRAFYAAGEAAAEFGAGAGAVDAAANIPLSQLLRYDAATMALVMTPAAAAAAAKHRLGRGASRVKRAKCLNAAPDRDSRGAIDNFDDTWFSVAVVGRGAGAAAMRCTARSKSTTPLWMPVAAMRDVLDTPEAHRANALRVCALRALVSEWNRRSYAVLDKCYVREGARWTRAADGETWRSREPPARRRVEACDDVDSSGFTALANIGARNVLNAQDTMALMEDVMRA